MKRRENARILAVLGAAVLVLVVTAAAGAAQDRVLQENIHKSFGSVEVPSGTTVMGDVTAHMGEVVIRGTVNGDVSAQMGQVTVTGDVNGNVRATMGQVVVTGSVSGRVEAHLGEIIVDGQVGGSVESSLGSVRINGLVGEDVRVTLGTLENRGTIGGSIYSEGKTVRIFGRVEGNIEMPRGIVELGPQAVVAGNIYVGEGLVDERPGARILGRVEVGKKLSRQEVDELFATGGYIPVRGLEGFFERNTRFFRNLPIRLPARFHYYFRRWPRTEMNLPGMLVLFGLSAIAYALAPKNLQTIREAVEERAGSVVLWGVIAAVAAPPLIVLTAVTIIGIPLAIILTLLLGLAWIVGYAGVALFLGARIRRAVNIQGAAPLGEIALGILSLGILSLIPLVRGIVGIAVLILALGSSFSTRLGSTFPGER